MLTKEEILKSKNLQVNDDVIIGKSSVVQSSLEEYAKQEALGFYNFFNDNFYSYSSIPLDLLWNEYQKSKLK